MSAVAVGEEMASGLAALHGAAGGSAAEREDWTEQLQEEAMDTAEHQEAAGNGEERQASPAPSSPSSSLTSPLLPLPDFMTALNMMPSGSGGQHPLATGGAGGEEGPKPPEETMTLGPGPKEVLIEKFKQSE